MKKKYLIAVTVLLAAVLAGGIIAYLQDRDNSVNLFHLATEQTEVVEKYVPPKKLTAGVTFPKEVQVENNGNISVYVRVMAVYTNEDAKKYATLDYNTDDWVYDRTDGYWYYKYSLEPGQLTSPLFREVSISADANESELNDFEIIVYHESCYDNGYATYVQAWETYLENLGKPAPSALAVYPSDNATMADGRVAIGAGGKINKSVFLTQAVLSDGTRYDLTEDEFTLSPENAPSAAGSFDVTVSASINGKALTGSIPCIAQNSAAWSLTSSGTHGFVKDSGDRWKSDNYHVDKSEATATFTVNIPKQVSYTFTYEVSSEPGWDKFTVILDGETIADKINGKSGEQSCTRMLSAGSHTIQVTYSKDSSGNQNDDCGYITLPDILF